MKNKITKLNDIFGAFFKSTTLDMQSIDSVVIELENYLKCSNIKHHSSEVDFYQYDEFVSKVLSRFEDKHKALDQDVTIIIPSRSGELVVSALNKLGENKFNIVVALNNTDFEKEKSIILENLDIQNKPKIIEHFFPKGVNFSFAEICNTAAKKYAKTKFLLFFNDDLLISKDELIRLTAYIEFNIIGAVAPVLKWPSDVVQNGGIFGGIHRNKLPGLYGRGLQYADINQMPLTCDAVTGACLMLRAEQFFKMKGFDEEKFAIAYNDVDLGYRLNESGLHTISMNHISAVHIEGATRGTGLGNDNPKEEVEISHRFSEYAQKVIPKRIQLILDPESSDFLYANQHPTFDYRNQNVVVFTHNMKLEGASRIAYDTAKVLSDSGFNVSILALEGGERLRDYQSFADNIHICGWDYFTNSNRRAAVSMWLQQHDISLVIANTVICSAALYPVTSGLKCKQINYIHESESFDHHLCHFGGYWVDQSALSIKNNFNVFVSRYTVNVYRYLLNDSNWTILYNYFVEQDLTQNKIKTQGYNFVTVGSVCERKNQKMVFDALDYFEKKEIPATFTLVGARNDQYANEIKSALESRTYLFSKLKIIDETPEVSPYYEKADIFISFSNMESFPITLLEASSHNLILMSTALFGAKEMIVEGVNGFLFEPNNVESMYKSFDKLLDDDFDKLKSSSKTLLKLWPNDKEFNCAITNLIKRK
ncbi:glycosyltransferase [Photobacterium sp. TLY01]|uniref:glycosyltransferase n=1 Tax=Photobacterium sp. TLY01 TaxID=2907534 RepID=UPI001F237FE9|nr:glycosyltransferase [Photobacterium sp. TLY01]UIP27212.1 glycosyltransferase [Photobacterium sp. TLY01]